PNSRVITVATRLVVQRSVAYPWARAPRASSRGKRSRCRAVNFGGRPGTGFGANAAAPCRRTASRHRQTALNAAPTMRATVASECPLSSNPIARRRRRSNSTAVPFGLMPPPIPQQRSLCITYATLNKAYLVAIAQAFENEIDDAMLVKLYGSPGERRERLDHGVAFDPW